ncbi:protein kinase activating protein dpb11 [Coemansia sp. RSA 2618]|nr:protein kinase activating protein dpb11 [Coemansia sp. RSA 2618]
MRPVFPLLQGCCISSSGLDANEKAIVQRRIERLGGSVCLQLTTLVTHVLVKEILFPDKYRVSAKVGLPVLSLDFLDECEKEARRRGSGSSSSNTPGDVAAAIQNIVERTWFRPFTGCIICTTGFEADIRDEISRLTTSATLSDGYSGTDILAHFVSENRLGEFDLLPKTIGGGGKYSPSLTPSCTHLIALTPESEKYKFAKTWDVQVISFEWFLQSVKTGYRQNEADFVINSVNRHLPGRSAANALSRATSMATRSSSAASGVMEIPPSRSSVVEQPMLRRDASAFSRTSSRISGKGETVFASRADRSPAASEPPEIDFNGSTDDSFGLTTWSGADNGATHRNNATVHLSSVSVSSTETCMALASCRIALSEASLSADERKEWRQKIATMGGVWISEGALKRQAERPTAHKANDDPLPPFTHYVVDDTEHMGSTDKGLLQALHTRLTLTDRLAVVGTGWLRACWETKARADEHPYAMARDSEPDERSNTHALQNPQSRLRSGRSLATSTSEADLLPPRPRYSLNPRSLTDSAQRRSFEHQRTSQSLVGKPMRSCSISDDELDPFMSGETGRKRGTASTESNYHDAQVQTESGHGSKRRRMLPSRQDSAKANSGAHGPAFSSSPQLELSARTADAADDSVAFEEPNLFAGCIFTSLGFSEDAQLVLKRITGENGGAYVELADCLPKASAGGPNAHTPLSRTQLQLALSNLARRVSDGGVSDVYLVLQLSGHDDVPLCEDVLARYDGMHVVTECWVEQCLQEGIRYPDYSHIELRLHELPGLSSGQHVLFRPLPMKVVHSASVLELSLSISGYEGMEREHIGKLAHALGISYSEKFSRKASHLVCRPPFQGPKYERALKWNIDVVDSSWLYCLAATGSTGVCDPDASQASICEAPLVHTTPALATRKDTRGQLSQAGMTGAAVNTPLSKSSQLLAGTPGRTPMDVSLERNLSQAMHNNARPRPTEIVTPSRHAGDEDATQLSPGHTSAAPGPVAHYGSVGTGALAHVLEGVVLGLSSRIQHRRVELTEVALQLGCRVLARFDSKQATHLVHQSLRERDSLRDCRTAVKADIAVVSPWWLYACRDAQARVSEAEFPCTFHPERHLKLVSTSPTAPSQNPTLKRTGDTSSSPVAPKPRAGHESAARIAGHVNARGDGSEQQVRPETVPNSAQLSITDTSAIGSMFGRKAAHAHRRYRPAQSSGAMDIDLTTDDDGGAVDANSELPLTHRSAQPASGPQTSAHSSLSSSNTDPKQASGQSAALARGKWWLNLGSTARVGHPAQLYSQDMQHGQYNELGTMPDTAAVEDALNPDLADRCTTSALATSAYSAATPEFVAETQPGNNAAATSGMQTSPLAAHRTTIVYGEDADALSVRDHLIRKLGGQ